VNGAKTNAVQAAFPALVAGSAFMGLAGLGYGAYRLFSSLGETLSAGVEQGLADAFSDDLWEQQLLGGRPEFHDQHLPNYANELYEYQQRISAGRPDLRPITRINTRRFTPQELAAFEDAVYCGWAIMWTLDVTDRLSVGMAGIASHAVLAQGLPVFAAGEGKPDMPQDWFDYKVYDNTTQLADWYKSQNDSNAELGWRSVAERSRPRTQRRREVRTHTVLLNFKSGHYLPTRAWRETLEAWQRVGFTVKKKDLGFTT